MPTVLQPDPFSATLLESPPLVVTSEQARLIRRVVDVASSDSQFANKLYNAITAILTQGSIAFPKVTSLNPTEIEANNGPFTLTVTGSQFTPTASIYVAGKAVATTYVSESQLTATVNIVGVSAPAAIPVAVVDKGVISDSVNFSLIPIP